MSIKHLTVQDLRNLQQVDMQPDAGINIITGANASGKTSLLEAIHMLALARSFRSHRLASVITAGSSACQLFARIDAPGGGSIPLGMSRRLDGEHQIRLNGETLRSTSELAMLLPVQVIAPAGTGLLDASPGARRQFLDWGAFHHDERFYGLWKQAQRLLKQRNSSLKCGTMEASVRASFEPALVRVSEQLDMLRKAYLEALEPLFFASLENIVVIPELNLSYYRGWNKDKSLVSVLDETLERDKQFGYTQRGPQRADLRFTVQGVNAAERLSRGQQKLVTIALRLAQGQLLSLCGQRRCLFLVDDLAAELDQNHLRQVCEQLVAIDSQVFVTAVKASELLDVWPQGTSLAHFTIEQGKVVAGHKAAQ
ncbi:MAG: DNA replication/repair protein RecF [Gammaproteobacteria bacterium]|nr:DNA replication/repair protein RecF [Gammaproteobacteria bacterium]